MGMVAYDQPPPAIMLSTPHLPVAVLRPSSEILNQRRPLGDAVAALSTLARYVEMGPLWEGEIGLSGSLAYCAPPMTWPHHAPMRSPALTLMT